MYCKTQNLWVSGFCYMDNRLKL